MGRGGYKRCSNSFYKKEKVVRTISGAVLDLKCQSEGVASRVAPGGPDGGVVPKWEVQVLLVDQSGSVGGHVDMWHHVRLAEGGKWLGPKIREAVTWCTMCTSLHAGDVRSSRLAAAAGPGWWRRGTSRSGASCPGAASCPLLRSPPYLQRFCKNVRSASLSGGLKI